MKVQLMSDLHMEFGSDFYFKDSKDTVLVLAGDIENRRLQLDLFISRVCKDFKAVVMVAGNHEFYGHEFHDQIKFLRGLGEAIGVDNFHFLENDIVKIEDVTFIGATLWSTPNWGVFKNISDHYETRWNNRMFNTDDLSCMNANSKEYIKHQLSTIEGKKIVVTHFGPDPSLMHPHWLGQNEMNTYFWSSGMEDYFHKADAWFYGHTHDSGYKVIDGCPCLCNPYGYFGANTNWSFKTEDIMEF